MLSRILLLLLLWCVYGQYSYLICVAVDLVRPSLWDKQCALKELCQNLLEM